MYLPSFLWKGKGLFYQDGGGGRRGAHKYLAAWSHRGLELCIYMMKVIKQSRIDKWSAAIRLSFAKRERKAQRTSQIPLLTTRASTSLYSMSVLPNRLRYLAFLGHMTFSTPVLSL